MKIKVTENGKRIISLRLPLSAWMLNFIIKHSVKDKKGKSNLPEIPPELIRQCVKILKKYSKEHGGLELVNLQSASGDNVFISI